jgi:hypothetical protein
MTPATISDLSSAMRFSMPTLMHQCGMPCRKLVVPSSGSTHPAPFPVRIGPRLAALLHEEGEVRAGLTEILAQRLLGAEVGLADEVAGALHGDLELLDLGEVAQQAPADLADGGHHDVQRGKRRGGGRSRT